MANKKITQLTAASGLINPIDLMEVSENDGTGVFTSKKITGLAIQQGFVEQNAFISAFSATQQTFAANVGGDVTLDTTHSANKITLGAFNELTVSERGFYQIDFTATILNNGGNSNYNIGFYLSNNVSSVADTSRFMNAPDNGHSISFQTSWVIQMNAGDFLTIVCVMEKASFELITENTLTGITTPSAQVIMKRIG
jgi:hypothetical protein